MMKITKISEPDLAKYKLQKNVRRRHVTVPTNYENIAYGTDQDVDGMHIRGLLLSKARKYMPWMLEEGRIFEFRTPIICIVDKNGKVLEPFFTFEEFDEYQKTHDITKVKIKYFKGLGSWQADVLSDLIERLGKDKFFVPLVYDEHADEVILNWFLDERVEYRKEQLQNNKFNLALA